MSIEMIIGIITTIIGVIAFIVTFIRTGSIQKSVGEFMKYRTPDYRSDKSVNETVDAQSFDNTKQDWKLDKHTNVLEKLETKTDLAAFIQSSIDSALDRVLMRLQPAVDDMPDTLETDYENTVDDLDDLAVAIDLANEYREKFNLPLETSVDDVFKYVQKQATEIKSKIDSYKNLDRGIKNDTIPQENDTPRE